MVEGPERKGNRPVTDEEHTTSWLYRVDPKQRATARRCAADTQEHLEAARASLTAMQREHGADVAVALEGLRLAADAFLAGLPGTAVLHRVTAALTVGGDGWDLSVTAVATGDVVHTCQVPGQAYNTVAAAKLLAAAGWTVRGTWRRADSGQAWTAAVKVRTEADRYARGVHAQSPSGLWSVTA